MTLLESKKPCGVKKSLPFGSSSSPCFCKNSALLYIGSSSSDKLRANHPRSMPSRRRRQHHQLLLAHSAAAVLHHLFPGVGCVDKSCKVTRKVKPPAIQKGMCCRSRSQIFLSTASISGRGGFPAREGQNWKSHTGKNPCRSISSTVSKYSCALGPRRDKAVRFDFWQMPFPALSLADSRRCAARPAVQRC